MSVLLPLVRGIYEFPWHTTASLPIACINTLIEIIALHSMLTWWAESWTDKTATENGNNKGAGDGAPARLCPKRATTQRCQGRGHLSRNGGGGAYLPAAGKRIHRCHQAVARNDVQAEINRLDSALAAAVSTCIKTQEQFADDITTRGKWAPIGWGKNRLQGGAFGHCPFFFPQKGGGETTKKVGFFFGVGGGKTRGVQAPPPAVFAARKEKTPLLFQGFQ